MTEHPMNGGDGLHSYSKNSTFQGKIIEATIEMINKGVEELIDVKAFLSSKTIKIADFGCSTGPNTFLAVETIIGSLEHRLRRKHGHCDTNKSEALIPEFQVFFNDQASNDFNRLFLSLPQDINYFAAGVPGSFYAPLFPKDSLHFVHSSSAVHWLSRIPEEVLNENSPAWNKGRVYYSNSIDDVARAYGAQFYQDIDKFLKFRAHEIVDGGLMAITTFARANGSSHSETYINKVNEQVEQSLIDMAKKGKIGDEKIDSFNIPIYLASQEEIESAVKRNGWFSIEVLEIVPQEIPQPKVICSIFRAAYEGMIKQHFGHEIIDELFGTLLPKNLTDLSAFTSASLELVFLFILLKRVKIDEYKDPV